MKKLLSILLVLLSCCYITLPAFAAEGDLSEPSIEIICDSDTVVIGKTLQLTYSVKNAENVSDVDWITSQSNIATINKSGVVKGNDIGRTIISVVAIADGKYVSAEKEICVIRKSRVVYDLLTKNKLYP